MMDEETPIPLLNLVNIHSSRNALVRYLKRYGTVVHGDGLKGLTPGEVQAEIGRPDERESRTRAIQKNIYTEIQRILSEIEEVKFHEHSVRARLIGIFGFFFAGAAFFKTRYSSVVTTTTRSVIRKFRTKSIRAVIKRYLLKFFSQAPIFWLVNGLALFAAFIINLIIQDTRVLVGIRSIKTTLNKIHQNIRRLENVSRSDMSKLTSWRWEVIPWQDRILDSKPAIIANSAGFEASTTDGDGGY
ncbi:hypothetical protein EYR41_008058 [Orbilia oligospora]|uniref:Uncharacterized protein n=1 Tax=Orbilia oligospora TaxID=2813651 RepID=A0A8H2DTG8_ORBOL|nr:hypothetical protein EYR41_008058 [Orbilia oligospora]